jgi:hypothetical protein
VKPRPPPAPATAYVISLHQFGARNRHKTKEGGVWGHPALAGYSPRTRRANSMARGVAGPNQNSTNHFPFILYVFDTSK